MVEINKEFKVHISKKGDNMSRAVICPECHSMQKNGIACPICKYPINKPPEIQQVNKIGYTLDRFMEPTQPATLIQSEDLELEDRKQIHGYYSQLYQEEQDS